MGGGQKTVKWYSTKISWTKTLAASELWKNGYRFRIFVFNGQNSFYTCQPLSYACHARTIYRYLLILRRENPPQLYNHLHFWMRFSFL